VAQVCEEAGLALLQGTRESLVAIRHLFEFARARTEPRGGDLPDQDLCLDRAVVQQALAELAAGATISGPEASALLNAYGIPVAQEQICRTADEALAAAARIGYPVAVKVVSETVHHKTDVGGVVLDVGSDAALAAAFARVIEAAEQGAPVTVQRMVRGGIEALVGYRRDPQLGGMLTVGSGGTATESVRDVAVVALPTDPAGLTEALARTRLDRLLSSTRGAHRPDREAFVEVLRRVACLLHDLGDSLDEMDLNPVLVLAQGEGTCVVDALFVGRR
jgi:acyl-CoA synthetase (NDP forming)